MKLRTLTAAAVLTFALAGTAFADGRVTATLQAPVAAKTKIVAAGAVFVCEGTTCVAGSAPTRTMTALGCKALVKEVGAVAGFAGEKRELEAADLTKCNTAARATATVTAAN